MTTLNIELSDEQFAALQKLAREAQLPAQDMVQQTVAKWLDRQGGQFTAAADYVLKKNAELYRRLA
jgi:predicted transcriptional regulator